MRLEKQYLSPVLRWVHSLVATRANSLTQTGEGYISSSERSTWGKNDLVFELPGGALHLTGLSDSQQRIIYQHHSDFLVNRSEQTGKLPICHAFQLDRAPKISRQAIEHHGQYAPLQIRGPHGVRVIGENFIAQIPLLAEHPPGSIGVVAEYELAYPNVIENVMRIYAAHRALGTGGLMLHSAGLVRDGVAYIFVGRSNAGKTTLTRKAFKAGARVLSDDINMLFTDANEAYRAHAVPFTGEFGRTLKHAKGRESYPLTVVVVLEQGDSLQVSSVGPAEAMKKILIGCPFVNMDADCAEQLYDTVLDIVKRVPVLRLQSMRDEPIENIFKAINKRIYGD